MRWNADFDFADFGIEGTGIVATLTCTRCRATAEFRTYEEDTDDGRAIKKDIVANNRRAEGGDGASA